MIKKIMLFEEFNQDFDDKKLNEGLKSFFNKLDYYGKRLRLETEIFFIKVFLPLVASGIDEKELLKSDVKTFMNYWREFIKKHPKATLKGLRIDVVDEKEPELKDLKTFTEFYRWLEKRDPDFIENYMGGQLKETYDKVINKANELAKVIDRYKAKNKKDLDIILQRN